MFFTYFLFLLLGLAVGGVDSSRVFDYGSRGVIARRDRGIAPKVLIISMFKPEAEVWYGIPEFNLLAHNITVPGLSLRFPDVHCTQDYQICQVVTDEGEINAATTLTALLFSPVFDLRRTYFLIAGIAGVNPRLSSIADVTFARYEVQVALQYEIDPRDLPANFSTGYIPQGAMLPSQYPKMIYGTEVFELNANLRDAAISLVKAANVTLADRADAQAYRARYAVEPKYKAATQKPSVRACDGATSDTYFSGTRLNEAFDNYTTLVTNGTGKFCASGQEDSATFEALLRSSVANRTDFGRIIAMRTASDFTAPPPGISSYTNLMQGPEGGFEASLANIKIAGAPIVQGIVKQWDSKYAVGVRPSNYIGDILGTLGGNRDFGLMYVTDNPVTRDVASVSRRSQLASQSRAKRALLPMVSLS